MIVPTCKCGSPCDYYGPIGGYSKQCARCNAERAAKSRKRAKERKMEGDNRRPAPFKFPRSIFGHAPIPRANDKPPSAGDAVTDKTWKCTTESPFTITAPDGRMVFKGRDIRSVMAHFAFALEREEKAEARLENFARELEAMLLRVRAETHPKMEEIEVPK